jgi:hypothetical protein
MSGHVPVFGMHVHAVGQSTGADYHRVSKLQQAGT